MPTLLHLHPFAPVIWCLLKFLTYPRSLRSLYGRGHTLYFLPPQ
jgi:hypothetical protein